MRELRAMAYFSLVYGGFLVITYLAFAYFAVWQHEFLPIFPGPRERFVELENGTVIQASAGANVMPAPPNETLPLMPRSRTRVVEEPLSQILSLQALAILLTGVAFLANGVMLLNHLRKKEHKETKRFVISSLLTSDEKAVYDELVSHEGESTQKQLAVATGFSPVKIYRSLQRLEKKGIVSTFPFGMTKKVILKEDGK